MLSRDSTKCFLRAFLFIYLGLILCPIQYWAPAGENDVDNTWIFALNYAAAHHLVLGRDVIWTSGPLAYLAAPMDVGSNLKQGLVFQAALWVVLLAILFDLFFRSTFPLRNLAFFSVFLGLSGPLYHHPPNPLGTGDLLLVGALILLVHSRLRGGIARYFAGLAMLGLVPLIKLVGIMMSAAVVAGLVCDRVLSGRTSAMRDIALTLVTPGLVAGAGFWITLGSLHSFALYFKGSMELSRGYNLAMSMHGPTIELLAAFEALFLFAVALGIVALRNRRMATFLILLLAVPVALSVKHAFVRQPLHAVYAFGFVALAVGLVSLATALDKLSAGLTLGVVTLLLATLCQDYVVAQTPETAIFATSGFEVPSLVWNAIRFHHLQQMLAAEGKRNFASDDQRLEPEIKTIVQHEPIASLSESYSGAYVEGLNLVLYPVIQRYSAYTVYLDKLNADWIRERGPRFLLFDGKSVLGNGRQPWSETPAMWAEAYRWYDTRLLGRHNLLLERRSQPRYQGLELVAHSQLRFGDEVQIPESRQPVFWTMQCSLTKAGRLRALLFRIPEVTMTADEGSEQQDTFRVVPELLESPSMGTYLPSNVLEFAKVFDDGVVPDFAVKELSFSGPGTSAYAPVCEVGFFQPVP
jgi:hypothetical protein